MDNLIIEATKRTPFIRFDFANHALSITGESYPEDINQFYGEIITQLETYLTETKNQKIKIDFDLIYFNSSSAKAMIRIFDMLDVAAEQNNIQVHWWHDVEDDNMAELGEEFGEDLTKAVFHLVVKNPDAVDS